MHSFTVQQLEQYMQEAGYATVLIVTVYNVFL
jgi:hypothetical protein